MKGHERALTGIGPICRVELPLALKRPVEEVDNDGIVWANSVACTPGPPRAARPGSGTAACTARSRGRTRASWEPFPSRWRTPLRSRLGCPRPDPVVEHVGRVGLEAHDVQAKDGAADRRVVPEKAISARGSLIVYENHSYKCTTPPGFGLLCPRINPEDALQLLISSRRGVLVMMTDAASTKLTREDAGSKNNVCQYIPLIVTLIPQAANK